MSNNQSMKRILLAALGVAMFLAGVGMWREETRRSMTPETVSGVLTNLHTVSGARTETLHFQMALRNGQTTRDLHSEEGLMFVKAQDGQAVEATFTRETGYVSKLHILSGKSSGYSYDEPDRRNTFAAAALCLLGLVLVAAAGFQWLTDRAARPD